MSTPIRPMVSTSNGPAGDSLVTGSRVSLYGAPGDQAGGVDPPHAAQPRQPDPDPVTHAEVLGGFGVDDEVGCCPSASWANPSSPTSSLSAAATPADAPPAASSSWLSASSSPPPAIRPVSSSRVTWLFS